MEERSLWARKLLGVVLCLMSAGQLLYYAQSGVLTDGVFPLWAAGVSATLIIVGMVAGLAHKTPIMLVMNASAVIIGILSLGSLLIVSPVTLLWLPTILVGTVVWGATPTASRALSDRSATRLR